MKKLLNFIFPKRNFKIHGTVKVPHMKNTENKETEYIPLPKEVVIPMLQHIGSPCNALVSKGDYVYKGQVIGSSDKLISSKIHASVSGTVKKIEKIKMPFGDKVDAIVIESDGKDELYSEKKLQKSLTKNLL